MEVWKPVVGHPDYEVSSEGQVRNRVRNRIKVPAMKRGYWQVALYTNGRAHHCGVHRLVAEAFIPNPENKRTVNHKDGRKWHNRVENLEWATSSENTQHGLTTGLLTVGEDRYNAKLTEQAVREIRASRDGLKVLAERFGVSITNIWNVKQRISWKHVA